MRSLTLVGVLAITSGCAAVDSDLQYRGTLDTETNGLVLFEDGESGHAAMSATTCVIDPDGGIADDVDIEGTDNEAVLDGTSDGGDTVLARTQDALMVIAPDRNDPFDFGNGADPRIEHVADIASVDDARLIDSGFVALADCNVHFLGADGTAVEAGLVELQGCTGMDPGFDADRATGTAYVGTDAGVVQVTPGEQILLPESADLIDFSPAASGLAIADAGDTEVRFMDLDGSLRWTTPVPGTVVDVAELGARGSVAVMLDSDGAGVLALLDVDTGALQRSFDLPGRAEIVASADGGTLALVINDAVHYYNLR